MAKILIQRPLLSVEGQQTEGKQQQKTTENYTNWMLNFNAHEPFIGSL